MISLFLGALRLALTAIVRNRMRAALTVLGILIGIMAVVVVAALAEGTASRVASDIDSFAANAIYVWPQSVQASGARSKSVGRLTENDLRAVLRDAVSIKDGAAFLDVQGQVVYGDRNFTTQIVGVTLPYYDIRRWTIARGSKWSDGDELMKTKVCVVGQTVVDKVFGTEDPVGHTLRIAGFPFTVVGVLGARGSGSFGDDQDNRVMMPASSFRARIVHTPPGRADQLMFSASSPEVVERAKAQITSILRQRHHIADGARPDFDMRTQADMRETSDSIMGMLSLFGIAVAAISLLVGGVGVMNIMLVSVAERTREIGIRMSIGARERDILVQFLVEAIVLTLIGGVLGIVAGSLGTLGLGRALDMNVMPSPRAIAVAVGTSAFIGTVFGLLPAMRAAKLDPIEALRNE
jgi:putative ABC transport system permease protein